MGAFEQCGARLPDRVDMNRLPLCPICEKNRAKPEFKPFCSKRCADVDLSRWLSDGYAIPGEASDQAEETPGNRRDTGETGD